MDVLLFVLHEGLARAAVLYLIAMGVWGLVSWRRGQGVSPSYAGALIIAQGLVLTQGALGMLMVAGGRPADAIHILYGISLVLALPLAYLYQRDKLPQHRSLIFGLASLFAFGLAMRGIQTG